MWIPVPKNEGNYRGKRPKQPTPRALTPDERFRRLQGMYDYFARRCLKWCRADKAKVA